MRSSIILIVLSVVSCFRGYAQVEAGIGGEIGFPLMFNNIVKGHNHASGVPGVRAVLNYTPKEGSISGTLVAGIAPMILPVVKFNGGLDVLYMDFTHTNITLMGRFKKDIGSDRLLFGVGIGLSALKGNNVQISKRSDNDISEIIIDSSTFNKATLPSFYLNAEYIRPIKQGSPIYYGIGAQLHYIYFLDQGASYRVDIVDKYFNYYSLKPELVGHMLNPMLYINLYYRFGKQ